MAWGYMRAQGGAGAKVIKFIQAYTTMPQTFVSEKFYKTLMFACVCVNNTGNQSLFTITLTADGLLAEEHEAWNDWNTGNLGGLLRVYTFKNVPPGTSFSVSVRNNFGVMLVYGV